MNGDLIGRLLMVLTGFVLALLGVIVFVHSNDHVTLDPNTGNIIGDPATGLFDASRERLDKAGLKFPDLPSVGSNIPFYRDKDGRIQLGKAKG